MSPCPGSAVCESALTQSRVPAHAPSSKARIGTASERLHGRRKRGGEAAAVQVGSWAETSVHLGLYVCVMIGRFWASRHAASSTLHQVCRRTCKRKVAPLHGRRRPMQARKLLQPSEFSKQAVLFCSPPGLRQPVSVQLLRTSSPEGALPSARSRLPSGRHISVLCHLHFSTARRLSGARSPETTPIGPAAAASHLLAAAAAPPSPQHASVHRTALATCHPTSGILGSKTILTT